MESLWEKGLTAPGGTVEALLHTRLLLRVAAWLQPRCLG